MIHTPFWMPNVKYALSHLFLGINDNKSRLKIFDKIKSIVEIIAYSVGKHFNFIKILQETIMVCKMDVYPPPLPF